MTHTISGDGGTITTTQAALAQIVVQAAESVDGARVRRRALRPLHLELELDGARARVELELTARYGEVLPELARGVQERVADALARMCGLSAETVDVTIAEVEGA